MNKSILYSIIIIIIIIIIMSHLLLLSFLFYELETVYFVLQKYRCVQSGLD